MRCPQGVTVAYAGGEKQIGQVYAVMGCRSGGGVAGLGRIVAAEEGECFGEPGFEGPEKGVSGEEPRLSDFLRPVEVNMESCVCGADIDSTSLLGAIFLFLGLLGPA